MNEEIMFEDFQESVNFYAGQVEKFLAFTNAQLLQLPFIDFTTKPPVVYPKIMVPLQERKRLREITAAILKASDIKGGVKMTYPRLLTRVFNAKSKFRDDQIRDEALKLEQEIADTLEIQECKTPKEIYEAFTVKNGGCCMRLYTEDEPPGISISGLWQEYKIHPSIFYYYWPEVKVWKATLDKKLVGRFFSYQFANKIQYSSIYTCVSGYLDLVRNKIKKQYPEWCYDVYNAWPIETDFEIPEFKLKNGQKLCPLPHSDQMKRGFYVKYLKNKQSFLLSQNKTEHSLNILNTYCYPGWITVE